MIIKVISFRYTVLYWRRVLSLYTLAVNHHKGILKTTDVYYSFLDKPVPACNNDVMNSSGMLVLGGK